MRKRDEIKVKGLTDKGITVYAPKNKGGAPYLTKSKEEQAKLVKLKEITKEIDKLFPNSIIRVANPLVEENGEYVEQKPTGYTLINIGDSVVRSDRGMALSYFAAQLGYVCRDLARLSDVNEIDYILNIAWTAMLAHIESGAVTKREMWERVLTRLGEIMPDDAKQSYKDFCDDPAGWVEKKVKEK